MADFEHLLESYDISDALDDIASADPPAYLKRCFAEGSAAPALPWRRVQQLAVCAMVLDALVNDRDYEFFERELIADWRTHYAARCVHLKDGAAAALRQALAHDRPAQPDAAAELELLEHRVAA